jgi:hypothetical protein
LRRTVSLERPFRDDRLGGILLTNSKDNDSALDTHARFALGGDGQDAINVRRVGEGDIPLIKTERDVVAYLRERREPQSLASICGAVKGNDGAIATIVKKLASDDDARVRSVDDGRWTKYTAA